VNNSILFIFLSLIISFNINASSSLCLKRSLISGIQDHQNVLKVRSFLDKDIQNLNHVNSSKKNQFFDRMNKSKLYDYKINPKDFNQKFLILKSLLENKSPVEKLRLLENIELIVGIMKKDRLDLYSFFDRIPQENIDAISKLLKKAPQLFEGPFLSNLLNYKYTKDTDVELIKSIIFSVKHNHVRR